MHCFGRLCNTKKCPHSPTVTDYPIYSSFISLRAKGILMERQHLGERDAFRKIQKISRDKRQTMKLTALDIIKASEIL